VVFERFLVKIVRFLSVNCAAGGQHEHRTITQLRKDGVVKTSANRRQK